MGKKYDGSIRSYRKYYYTLIINNSIDRATNELFNEASRNAIKYKYVMICSKSTFFHKKQDSETHSENQYVKPQTNKLKPEYGTKTIFVFRRVKVVFDRIGIYHSLYIAINVMSMKLTIGFW